MGWVMNRSLSALLSLVILGAMAACSDLAEVGIITAGSDDDQVQAEVYTPRAPVFTPESIQSCSKPKSPTFDRSVVTVPAKTEPAVGEVFLDPVFGNCLLRVTDRGRDLAPDDPSGGMKNEYSRVQSYNADGTLLLVRSTEARWYVFDAQNLVPLRELPIVVDPRWDPEDPLKIYFFDETALMVYDLALDKTQVIHDFQKDFPGTNLAAAWMRYEGSPSLNGRYWGLMAQDQDWETVALLVYDQVEDSISAVREVPSGSEIDSVTISPNGNYLLAYHDETCGPANAEADSQPCGLMVYDQTLSEARNLLPVVGHSDIAIGHDGSELLVFQDIPKDEISMLDLETGEVTSLASIDFSHSPLGFHFSGRAVDRPGWALVSTYSGARPSATWMDDVVFAIELKSNGQIVRLAHTQSVVDDGHEKDYWAEPQASVNTDFTRVVFTSNWGKSGTDEVDMYMIILPEGPSIRSDQP